MFRGPPCAGACLPCAEGGTSQACDLTQVHRIASLLQAIVQPLASALDPDHGVLPGSQNVPIVAVLLHRSVSYVACVLATLSVGYADDHTS